jgi:AcrR family transcriptional regulator
VTNTATTSPAARSGAGAAGSVGSGSGAVTGVDGASDTRRVQMLAATIDVIVERGFPETRIADVAERAGVSPALVIYYFKTKDNLLAEAMRYSEDGWYAEMARRTAEIDSAAGRLEEVVAMSCLGGPEFEKTSEVEDSWAVWLDLWAQALRDPQVRQVREEFDEHFRQTIRQIVRDGITAKEFSEIDEDDFAIGYSALLDGFAIQIALGDPVVDARRAFELAMRVAAQQLGYEWKPSPAQPGQLGQPVLPAASPKRPAKRSSAKR